MKLTFIGAGNIGGATALGFIAGGVADAKEVTVTARHRKSLARFRALGATTTTDNAKAVKGADVVFFAVKPWQMEAVLKNLRGKLDFGKQLLVSIAPGVSSADLLSWLGKDRQGKQPALAYAIPNTAIEICESMTFLSSVTATARQMRLLKAAFDKTGKAEIVSLKQMLAGTNVASCGIAYAMRYISASAKGAKQLGLGEERVNDIVCQTVSGASALIAVHGTDPEAEINRVTTPNGMTLRGLEAMEKSGFSEAVVKGLTAKKFSHDRIVVKVGSNVLSRADGTLDTTRVSSIVDQIVAARRMGYDIVLVTSGAVACGRSVIRLDDRLDEVQQRQLYSAVGQVRLMDHYYKFFMEYGVNVGQILTAKKNFSGRREYDNQSNCIETMIRNGVVPIVNENDTVSIKELMFTDNDELSGLVATMIGAKELIILSNVDGIYTGDPALRSSRLLPKIRVGEKVSKYISEKKSSLGRGGMTSKCRIALETAAAGIPVIIANGTRDQILTDLLTKPEKTVHTEFTK